MHVTKPAEQVLSDLINTLMENLEEICRERKQSSFQLGEVYAYSECLEIIQLWEKSKDFGLYFNVEHNYKIF